MEVTEQKRGEVKIIELRGRLDAIVSPDVERRLLALVAQGETRMVFDLSGLSYISSTGLRVLMAVARQVQAARGKLALASINENVHGIFKIAGFTELFSEYQTIEGAVIYCAG